MGEVRRWSVRGLESRLRAYQSGGEHALMPALFEHSPWVEERADARPSSGDRHADLMAVMYGATPEEQLALIRAHPELAGKAAIDRRSEERRVGKGCVSTCRSWWAP